MMPTRQRPPARASADAARNSFQAQEWARKRAAQIKQAEHTRCKSQVWGTTCMPQLMNILADTA
eukprot:6198675-Pleurochrysis_carterae.AAC.2